jgi:lipopolysaccharide/colanic/teichoic acid biosynthesis glycosyltransferase
VLPKKLSMYEMYVDQKTFWLDLKILLRTLVAIWR